MQSYGLFALPITLIRGSKKLEDEQDLVEMDRLQIRLKKMRLQQKYAKKGGKVSSAHARELAKLEKEEKLLKYQQAGLQVCVLNGFVRMCLFCRWVQCAFLLLYRLYLRTGPTAAGAALRLCG